MKNRIGLKLMFALVASGLLAACGEQRNQEVKPEVVESIPIQQADQNQIFEEFKTSFLTEFWSLYPSYAVSVGYYKHHEQLTIPNEVNQIKEAAFEKKILATLNDFDSKKLLPSNATDLELIRNQIESSRWYREVFKSGEWNPANYNVAATFGLILNTDYQPLERRLNAISKRLDKVPAYYQAAISNLSNPTLEHTDFAIQQNIGALGVFQKAIPESIEKSNLTEQEKTAFKPKLIAAITAIEAYVAWLESKREEMADGGAKNFRIGEELYEQKFKYDIVSDFTAKQLYQKAIAAKQKLHAEALA